MLRLIFAYVVPLIAPAVVYFLWQGYLQRRSVARGGDPHPQWWHAPWPLLGVAGVALLALVLAILALTGGAEPGEDYVPPSVGRDGGIAPGGFPVPPR